MIQKNMVNEFIEGGNNLATVNYSSFLQQILRKLPDYPLFQISSDRQRLVIQIDELAKELATTPGVENPLTSTKGVRTATINFAKSFSEEFPSQTWKVRSLLQQQLAGAIGHDETIQQFVDRLILDNFQALPKQKRDKLGLWQNFAQESPNQQTQELAIATNRPGSESALKLHKLTITVRQINQFQAELIKGIENYIDSEVESDSDREELYQSIQDQIEDELSDFQELQRIVDTETLGKLKKQAQIIYLEYLQNNIPSTDEVGRIYLQDLIRRLKLIEDHINDPNKTDADYEVNYAGVTINYRDVFSRAEAFNSLPIIPIVAGNLGEYTDTQKGETQLICGFKLKLNGKVQADGGQKSFDYHVNLINPESTEHRENLAHPGKSESFAKKVLQRVLLYHFIFDSRSNPLHPSYDAYSELNYNPIESFEAKVLPILQGNDDAEKKKLFSKIIDEFNTFNIRKKIDRLRNLLTNSLKQQTILPTETYRRHINVRKGILADDIESMFHQEFFNEDIINPKKCLRYISIDKPTVETEALCQIPATIAIEDIRYFTTETQEKFSWKYQIDGIKVLPVLWTPKNEDCRQKYRQNPGFPNSLIVFVYDNTCLGPNKPNALKEQQAFTYRFTWVFLSYICFDILLENVPNNLNLFIPQVRLHQGTHEKPLEAENFLANLSKSLSQILSEKYRSNSQGWRIEGLNEYRINYGLSSLYSVLPKQFRFTQTSSQPSLDKLAIVVVSSRESDALGSTKYRHHRKANLMGEVVSIQRLADHRIRLERLSTFSDNYDLRRLYSEPPILIDTVSNLYRQGYRHFLYIAQAPYTSTLHITNTDRDEGLYFMSPRIIQGLRNNHEDIKIYPVFFDKYYVRSLKKIDKQSLYVKETAELTSLSKDPQQQAVVFFNLFNGITVGKGDERFYNAVMSYSTLLGQFYPGVLDDRNIRQDLIYQSPLKNDILQYLTLFHFSRFEKNQKVRMIKLDPYDNLIGDKSFGALSMFPQMTERIEFNSLAFLTALKKVLNGPKS